MSVLVGQWWPWRFPVPDRVRLPNLFTNSAFDGCSVRHNTNEHMQVGQVQMRKRTCHTGSCNALAAWKARKMMTKKIRMQNYQCARGKLFFVVWFHSCDVAGNKLQSWRYIWRLKLDETPVIVDTTARRFFVGMPSLLWVASPFSCAHDRRDTIHCSALFCYLFACLDDWFRPRKAAYRPALYG